MLQCWHPCDNTRVLGTCTRGTCHTGQWPHVSDTGNTTCPWQISILPRNKLWTELLWIFVCENEIDDKLCRAAIYLTDWLTQVGQLTTRLQPLCVNLRFFRGLTPSFIRWITQPFVSIFTQTILCNCETDFRSTYNCDKDFGSLFIVGYRFISFQSQKQLYIWLSMFVSLSSKLLKINHSTLPWTLDHKIFIIYYFLAC